MYKKPSRRNKSKPVKPLNLIPILDAVFILIFFLLKSASFLNIKEIQSDVPLVSTEQPKKNEKPLALTLKVTSSKLILYTGVPSRAIKSIDKNGTGEYDYLRLHDYLISLKGKYLSEKTIILEPLVDIPYEILVKIMDSVRYFEKTDPAYYRKDKDGQDVKVNELFSNIIFGNIQS